jgi:hypothetical protein
MLFPKTISIFSTQTSPDLHLVDFNHLDVFICFRIPRKFCLSSERNNDMRGTFSRLNLKEKQRYKEKCVEKARITPFFGTMIVELNQTLNQTFYNLSKHSCGIYPFIFLKRFRKVDAPAISAISKLVINKGDDVSSTHSKNASCRY